MLEALRDTDITVGGKKRRLLDEVDVITSVSGGSYTAAYYSLFGDRIFDDFTDDFLYHDWQGELMGLAFRPGNIAAMASANYNRSDLVAAHLDRTLFQGKTFADMSRDGRPFVIINASDLNNATTSSCIQQQFDFLCSDLTPYPVANAVMASSALPGPISSIALHDFDECGERHQPWVGDALAHDDVLDRRRVVAMALERYSHPVRMPVLRLVDGGVTDNLGVRGSMIVEEIVHRRRARRFWAMFTTAIWVVALIQLARAAGLSVLMPGGFAVTGMVVLGGAVLGIGVSVNRACAIGSVARGGRCSSGCSRRGGCPDFHPRVRTCHSPGLVWAFRSGPYGHRRMPPS